jgi:hypothetical protein
MDQRLNPYTPGSGVKPLKLAGRDRDLETFTLLLTRLTDGQPERSLIYSGLRGVGKTVLLLEFETVARQAGWACNDVEEVGSGDFRLTFAELAYQLLLSMSRKERMRTRALGIERPEVVLRRPAGRLQRKAGRRSRPRGEGGQHRCDLLP